MSDPLEPLKKIGEQLAAAAEALGLNMETFAVVPDFTGTSHMVQAVFTLTDVPDQPEPVDADQVAIDEQLKEMEREMAKDAEDEKLAEVARSAAALRERLGGGGGFLES